MNHLEDKRCPVWSVWNVSQYGVFSGRYFPAFGPEKNSIFGHFLCSGGHDDMIQKDDQLKKSMPTKFVLITLMNVISDNLSNFSKWGVKSKVLSVTLKWDKV